MKIIPRELSPKETAVVFLSLILASNVFAEEKIIQKEAISFEKCLKVISTSENKLSIAPEIKKVSSKKHVAVFSLLDGKLTITCDGIEGYVIVSTNMD